MDNQSQGIFRGDNLDIVETNKLNFKIIFKKSES